MATNKNGYDDYVAKRPKSKKQSKKNLHIQYLKDMHGNGAVQGRTESKNTNC